MKQILFTSTCLKMSPTLNIISETKRVVRPLLENLKTSISPDMLDAGMGMKKKKENEKGEQ